MKADARLLLVGCGKMGGALLQRVLDARLASDIYIVDPNPPDTLRAAPGFTCVASPDVIDAKFVPDIIILAVKPQNMAATLPAYARYKSAVYVSIAAGITIARLQSCLNNDKAAIVRSMPNLPASIGMGMTVAVANRHTSPRQKSLCEMFLKAVGEMAWVEDEKLIDAVTALSGNGPAYIFALCEALAKAGEALGLTPDMAAALARQTAIGSGALLAQSSESAEALRRAVTSPGGTTEAAMKSLLATGGLYDVMLKAMTAATERSKELSQ